MHLFSVPTLGATYNVPFPQWGDVGVEKHPLHQMVHRQGRGRLLSTDPEGKVNPVRKDEGTHKGNEMSA